MFNEIALEHEQIAVEDHTPENKEEIELKVGDTIGIAGNHWNGFSKGVNRRTEKSGMYPSYKVGVQFFHIAVYFLDKREMETGGLPYPHLVYLSI